MYRESSAFVNCQVSRGPNRSGLGISPFGKADLTESVTVEERAEGCNSATLHAECFAASQADGPGLPFETILDVDSGSQTGFADQLGLAVPYVEVGV